MNKAGIFAYGGHDAAIRLLKRALADRGVRVVEVQADGSTTGDWCIGDLLEQAYLNRKTLNAAVTYVMERLPR